MNGTGLDLLERDSQEPRMLTRDDAHLAPEKLREYPIIQVRYGTPMSQSASSRKGRRRRLQSERGYWTSIDSV